MGVTAVGVCGECGGVLVQAAAWVGKNEPYCERCVMGSRKALQPRPNNIPIEALIQECIAMNKELFERLADKRGIHQDEGRRDVGGGSGDIEGAGI